MASVLFEYDLAIKGPDGIAYRARACGAQLDDGMWQGWIEFLPPGVGKVLLSPRETSQPNGDNLRYWAAGLTPVYLKDALGRAKDRNEELAVPTGPPPALAGQPPSAPASRASGAARCR